MKKLRFLQIAILFVVNFTLSAIEFQEADIVIPNSSSSYWNFCGKELSSHLSRITGKKFPVATSFPKDQRVKIYLGVLPDKLLNKDVDTLNGDGFYIIINEREIYIAGLDTNKTSNTYSLLVALGYKGTLFGVYDFLERCGIRFLAPGDSNTFIPTQSKILLKNGTFKNIPAFRGRALADLWKSSIFPDGFEYIKNAKEMELWALRNKSNYSQTARGCHTEQFLQLKEIWWKNNRENFQLMLNGKRNSRYLCWSNPAVKDMWIKCAKAFFRKEPPAKAGLSHIKVNNFRGQQIPDEFMIDPMDHGSSNDGRCRCSSCTKFHSQYPCSDDTEILWHVISEAAKEVQKEFPNMHISTLIYPPKQQFPKTVVVPKNMRVRLCLNGAKAIPNEKILNREILSLKKWSSTLGRNNTNVWLYQCEIHGGKLPGPPETYLENFGKYLQLIKPYCNEVFQEYHALNFTYRHFDSYAEMRLMWDPKLNVETMKKEFFNLYYGIAGPEMLEIFNDFEKSWKHYWQLTASGIREADIGLSKNGPELRKIAWSKVYTSYKLQKWNNLIAKALLKVGSKTVLGKRIALQKKYVLDRMTEERRLVMHLSDSAPTIKINSKDWKEQKIYSLVPAGKLIKNLKSQATIQFRVKDQKLQIKMQIIEEENAKIIYNPEHRDGDEGLWQDCTVELFFSKMKSKKISQLIFTLKGLKVMRNLTPKETKTSAAVPGNYRINKNDLGYEFFYEIPLKDLSYDKSHPLLFNVTREHRVHGRAPEYSTFSPAALLGYWDNPDSFAKLLIIPKE